MTPIVAGITGGTAILGSVLSSNASRKAASTQARAAEAGQETQREMFEQGQETQRQMFERTQEILRPYVQAGEAQLPTLGGYTTSGPQAFERQLDLAGLRGPQAQQAAIEQVRTQPRFGAPSCRSAAPVPASPLKSRKINSPPKSPAPASVPPAKAVKIKPSSKRS